MWVEFAVGSHPSSKGFSSGSPDFLPLQKTNTSKFLMKLTLSEGRILSSCRIIQSYLGGEFLVELV